VTGGTTLGNASGDALTIASSAVTWSGNPTHSGNHTFSGGITLASPLPTSSGGTGLSSFTANRVFYSSSTSAIGSSANLTFDGTTLTAAAFSGPLNGTVGATTPASGAFTALSATGNVNLNGGTFVFNDSGADLDARFEGDTDASLLFLDASTDRVGVGTNSPASKLHLGNNLTTTNTIPFQIGYAADFYGYRLINTNNPSSAAAGTFSLQRGTTTAWVDVLTSDNNGNVGIGTSSPAQILDIIKAQNAGTAAIVRNGNTGASASAQLIVNADTATGRFAAYSSGAGALANHVSIEQTTNNPITFYTNSSERVRITGAGDAGIGTNSPASKLHVVGNFLRIDQSGSNQVYLGNAADLISGAPAGGALRFDGTALRISAGSTQVMHVTSSGDVGIGTNSPSKKLMVNGFSNLGGSVYSVVIGDGTFSAGVASIAAESGSRLDIGTAGANSLHLFANNTERMRITSAGNIIAGAQSALATTATDGFLYVPTCAGTPTGTPTAITGMAPIVVNTTNNKLYFYSGGAWRDAGP
jgi:hypothetical protein